MSDYDVVIFIINIKLFCVNKLLYKVYFYNCMNFEGLKGVVVSIKQEFFNFNLDVCLVNENWVMFKIFLVIVVDIFILWKMIKVKFFLFWVIKVIKC